MIRQARFTRHIWFWLLYIRSLVNSIRYQVYSRQAKITFSMRRLLVTRMTSAIFPEIDAGPSISTTPFRPAHATATTCKPRESSSQIRAGKRDAAAVAAVATQRAGGGGLSAIRSEQSSVSPVSFACTVTEGSVSVYMCNRLHASESNMCLCQYVQ